MVGMLFVALPEVKENIAGEEKRDSKNGDGRTPQSVPHAQAHCGEAEQAIEQEGVLTAGDERSRNVIG